MTPATIASTICVSGWTTTVRPPSTYTNALKVDQMKAYGYANAAPGDFEEDHLIPLELGGAPRDPRNLWPEPLAGTDGARQKDQLENRAREEVCAGRMALADAQSRIAADWRGFYDALFAIAATAAPTSAPTDAPTAAPTATPTDAPAAATPAPTPAATAAPVVTGAPPLTVTIVTSAWGNLAATTLPGASCAARAKLPSGNYSAASGITATKTADATGAVSWIWTRTSSTTSGTGTYTVTCTLAGVSAAATSTFSVP